MRIITLINVQTDFKIYTIQIGREIIHNAHTLKNVMFDQPAADGSVSMSKQISCPVLNDFGDFLTVG